MPAYVDTDGLRGLGAKIVAFFAGNAALGEPTHRATIAMLDPDRGELLALVAGETITERRTAAVSVVATQRLAARPRGHHAVLGAGLQGHAHVRAFVDAGLVESLTVWSRTPENGLALVDYARTLGIADARLSPTPSDAVRGADVITAVTSTTDPLLLGADLANGVHVNAVGSCTPERRELASDVVGRAAVFVDSRDAALRESGDILIAMRELDCTDLITAELGQMIAEPERSAHTREITVFKSLGLGIEDVICAAYVLAHADA
jgi:ornithine cyclodeaminase/alanine dehydrogenase-like protein (mu-crystallin family)